MFAWLKTHKLLVFIVGAVLLAGWYFFLRKPSVEYDSFTVTRQDLAETLELSGEVAAANSATLRFGAGGLVTYLGAHEGDVVKKWQTLASVDTRLTQKVLEQKLNLYAIARGTFEQTIDDNDNSVPDGDLARTLKRLLEKNQYQLDNTVKDVEYQDLTLKLSRLTSPLAGILVSAPITTSNVQVLPTDTWTVVDPASLYFSADVDETDLGRIHVGQKVIVTLDAFPDLRLESTISHIAFSPKETSTGTTFEVKIPLIGKVDLLRLGLNGTGAVVLTEKSQVLTLPAAAITGNNGDTHVYVKVGNQYQEHQIKTGIEADGLVEITEGGDGLDQVYAPQ